MKKSVIAALIFAALAGAGGASAGQDITKPHQQRSGSFAVLWIPSDKDTGPNFDKLVVTNLGNEANCYTVSINDGAGSFELRPGQQWLGNIASNPNELGAKPVKVTEGGCSQFPKETGSVSNQVLFR